MSISLAISHTPWVPERVKSMDRLLGQILNNGPFDRKEPKGPYKIFDEKEPNWVWSEKMWKWAQSTGTYSHLFLQDDVIVAPNFWKCLDAMLEGNKHWEIIGLHCPHPAARTLLRDGAQSWYTSADSLIGVGYVMSEPALVDFLQWREYELEPHAIERIHEDDQINLFALARGMKIWHPVPTIIDHDLGVSSTYDNDHHMYRRPQATWKDLWLVEDSPFSTHDGNELTDQDFWDPGDVPHLGRFYKATHHYLPLIMKDKLAAQQAVVRAEKDTCPEQYARFFVYP